MKKFIYIISFLVFTASFCSCSATQQVKNSDNQVAGYNLKSKREKMEQKILNNKNKILLATP
ncbi:hypothetical protein [Aequorivita echinoideorum]|uniref:Lipoprotein n=1 Tax=Aequorivita echinoideorum TaxID=1549647 RepID=A0ABS5S379_9FLAO|nr:hypothetical protein [Aequorivita echinoideorum]MBT0607671.1 hypothetical protein [Aequorivita echinoideorum]